MENIRGIGWRSSCPRCVASKFVCDEHRGVSLTDTPLSAEDVLKINGVAMIIDQGNLDHWFNARLWGEASQIHPTGKAFELALGAGLVEQKGEQYRLTDAGRRHRSLRNEARRLRWPS